MKRWLLLSLCLIMLAGCTETTPAPTAASPSPAPSGTPQPTPTASRTPLPTAAATPRPPLSLVERWQYGDEYTEAFWTLDAADLDGDGRLEILAASHDRNLYAFSGDGQVLWTFRAAAPIYSACTVPPAEEAQLRILIGDDSDRVYGLDAGGALLWQMELTGRVTHLARADGIYLAATWDETLVALSASGETMWQSHLPGMPTSLEVGSFAGADILVGTGAGVAVGMTAEGHIAWEQKVSDAPIVARWANAESQGGPAWLAGDQQGTLTAWDETGQRLWDLSIGGGTPVWTAAETPSGPVFLVGAGQPANAVYALSADGQPLWRSEVGGGVWHLATADLDGDGLEEILAATEGGTVTMLSFSGHVRGVWHSPSRVVETVAVPVAADEPLLVVVREGRFIHALEPQPGTSSSGAAQTTVPTLSDWQGTVPAEEGTVLLAAVGDIMLGRTVEEFADRYGVFYPFAPVARALAQADIGVGNLECAIAAGGEPFPDKYYTFRAHPALARGLGQSGLNVMSLANNHSLDFGIEGLQETMRHLEEQGIAHLGAGANAQEAARPLIREINGVTVALVAFVSYAPGFAATDTSPGVNFLFDLQRLDEAVQEAREQADVVVVILHGGTEYARTSNAEQRAAAHSAIDAGADLVIGHHPHVLQDTEIYQDRLIVYSLGDFVFDIDNVDEARDGAVLWAWIDASGVRRVELWRTRIVYDAQVRFVAGDEGNPKREVLLP